MRENVVRQPQMGEIVRSRGLIADSRATSPSSRWTGQLAHGGHARDYAGRGDLGGLDHARVEAPQHAALVLFGSLLLVTTPSYPWCALPLVVLAVLARRLEWLALPAAGYLAHAFALVPPVSAIGYGVAAAVVIGVAIRRRHQGAPGIGQGQPSLHGRSRR